MKKCICKDSDNYKLYLTKSEYTNNGRIYLGLLWYDENEESYELWGDITINLSDLMIMEDIETFISNDLDNKVYKQLVKIGLLVEIDTMQYNYGKYKHCYINEDIMNEYLEEVK